MRVRDARQTFLGWWLRQLVDGEELLVYGDGRQLRDFNFVDDVVDALLLAAASPAANGQIYNLGAGKPISLIDLAELLIDINGRGGCRIVPFPSDRRRIDIGDYHGDYTKIKTHLGWEPSTPLREGLQQTLDFYRRHREHYW
jgi:UDP-glucose 4-epimerase